MLKLGTSLVALCLLLGAVGPVAAAATGTALGVDPSAEAQGKGAPRTLVVGADVFIGERIVTGDEGQVQILFSDNTRLVVGPRSSLLIEDYLLREDGSAGNLAINALSGTFRFVTGGAPKNRYVINTPTGTIGVRGTSFELVVAGLLSYVLLQHGSVILKPDNGPEAVLEDNCEFGILSADGAEVVGNTDDVSGDDRDLLKQIFIYVVNQTPLLSKFKITNAERCLRLPPPAPGGSSLSEPNKSSVIETAPKPQGKPGYTYN